MVADAFNPSTWEEEASETSLVYMVSSWQLGLYIVRSCYHTHPAPKNIQEKKEKCLFKIFSILLKKIKSLNYLIS